MRRLLPGAFLNLTSLFGLFIAATAALMIVLLFLVDMFGSVQNPYVGLLLYIVFPGIMLFGLFVAAVGAWRTRRRQLQGVEGAGVLPRVDLNNPRQRRAAFLVAMGLFLFLVISSFGSYQAYEFTDSVQFCGEMCHKVMKPEYTAYQASPHARVSCVQCHIGAGATWFVRSKISGSYQVYSTLFNKYPRPIPTPVENLRPARETCEQCHWPKQFYSAKLEGRTYFLPDETNSRSRLNMLMKIGGGKDVHGAAEGIHAHMYLNATVRYIANDRQRNDIPYIEVTLPDGKKRIYQSTENPLPADRARTMPRQLVDCIECHNRPTHIFHHPAQSVNQAMANGRIATDLPGVKRLLVETLEKPYKTEQQAVRDIREAILAYYRENHPRVASARTADIDAAIVQAQTIYKLNYFPEMKVSWKEFPDHIGHMVSPGCFRCHDGKHKSDDGRVLSKDCNVCHTMLSQQGPADAKPRMSLDGLEWQHPMEIGTAWNDMLCHECHGQQPGGGGEE